MGGKCIGKGEQGTRSAVEILQLDSCYVATGLSSTAGLDFSVEGNERFFDLS